MIVLDSHCDTPSQLLRCRVMEEDNRYGHVDFPKLRRGGVDACFFALFTPNTLSDADAAVLSLRMLEATRETVAKNPHLAALATSPDEIAANKAAGKVSIFLGMENGSPLCGDLSLLRFYYDQGVRYLTLTHNGDNLICDSAAGNCRWNGLSPFGREVVAEMNRLGMMVDIAHCSDKTFWDCIEASRAPIVSTHSCCRALAGHRRNLTDDMIRALADKGGVIQINFYPLFLSDAFARELEKDGIGDAADAADKAFRANPSDPELTRRWHEAQDALKRLRRPGVKDVVDHIDHAVRVGGIDHVGIGTDFDGIDVPPEGLEDISMLPKVFDEMRRRGYGEEEIAKVAGGNFLRVFEEVIALSQSRA